MSEREALNWILDHYGGTAKSLREYLEWELPHTAEHMGAEHEDYYTLMLLLAEKEAERRGVETLRIYTDRELLAAIEQAICEQFGLSIPGHSDAKNINREMNNKESDCNDHK